MKKIELTCTDGTANKFWHATQNGMELKVEFGRINTLGQQKIHQFASVQAAIDAFEKQSKEKRKKGYVVTHEVDDGNLEVGEDTGPRDPVRALMASDRAAIAAVHAQFNAAAAGSNLRRDILPAETAAPVSKNQVDKVPVRRVVMDADMRGYAFHKRGRSKPLPPKIHFDVDQAINEFCASNSQDDRLLAKWKANGASTRGWTTEECLFWLNAILEAQRLRNQSPGGWHAQFQFALTREKPCLQAFFADFDWSKRPSTEKVIEAHRVLGVDPNYVQFHYTGGAPRVQKGPFIRPLEMIMYPLAGLFSLPDLVEIWQSIWQTYQNPLYPQYEGTNVHSHIFTIMRKEILPYLTDAQIDEARDYLRREMARLNWTPKDGQDQVPLPYLIAGLLGMHDELLPLINSIPDNFYQDETLFEDLNRPQLLLLGLNDRETLVAQWKRLGLRLSKSGEGHAWIAHTEWHNLDVVFPYVESRIPDNYNLRDEQAATTFQFIARIIAPETAPYIFKLYQHKTFTKRARKWMDENPLFTFIGLLTARQTQTPLAEKAQSFLNDLVKRLAREDVPSEYQNAYDEIVNAAANLRESLGSANCPAWLTKLFKESGGSGKVVLPAWLEGASLPPVIVDGYVLPDDEILHILEACKRSSCDKISPLLLGLREKADRQAFDAFTWDLLQRWLTELGPSKDKWCLLSIGYLASDTTLLKLMPLMKDWRAHGNPGRAAYCLEALQASGSEIALMKLHEISQTNSLKSLKPKALERMRLIAQARGLNSRQLEDRIVPTCGLDSSGKRTFDFGPRQFRFVLGHDLKPYIKDESGKLKADLPAPNQNDDPEKSSEAVKEWKELKTQIKAVVKLQVKRFEMALVSNRRWDVEEFKAVILNHPLIKVLCRPLVWAVFDENGKLTSTFRITEEGELADIDEKSFSLPAAGSVGLAHPLELTADDLAKWGQIMADYDLVAPFAQLGRPILKMHKEEVEADKITRFQNMVVEAVTLAGGLDKRDWTREAVGDGGVFCGHYKYFEGKDITAYVSYTGIMAGMLVESDAQELGEIGFAAGNVQPSSWWITGDIKPVKLDTVDPVIMSEVLSDLSIIMAKAKSK